MSYAIIRNANYKQINLAGLYKHNERKNTNYSNKEINESTPHMHLVFIPVIHKKDKNGNEVSN